jgi:hypothetical protein
MSADLDLSQLGNLDLIKERIGYLHSEVMRIRYRTSEALARSLKSQRNYERAEIDRCNRAIEPMLQEIEFLSRAFAAVEFHNRPPSIVLPVSQYGSRPLKLGERRE